MAGSQNRPTGLVPGPTGSRGAAAPFGTWPANGSCGGPTTTGIDIRVSSDRVIALDTQPVRSAGVLLRLLQREALPAGLGAAVMGLTTTTGTRGERRPLTDVSAEALAELMDLQIAMWLLRVCDAVVVMCPESDAEGPLELISAAGMLLSSVPRPTSTWQPAKGGTDPGEENVRLLRCASPRVRVSCGLRASPVTGANPSRSSPLLLPSLFPPFPLLGPLPP